MGEAGQEQAAPLLGVATDRGWMYGELVHLGKALPRRSGTPPTEHDRNWILIRWTFGAAGPPAARGE